MPRRPILTRLQLSAVNSINTENLTGKLVPPSATNGACQRRHQLLQKKETLQPALNERKGASHPDTTQGQHQYAPTIKNRLENYIL